MIAMDAFVCICTKNIGKKNITNSTKKYWQEERKLNKVLNECLRIIDVQI